MQVFLDGDPILTRDASLAAALAHGSSLAAAKGRVVIEVHADGSLLDESALNASPHEESSPEHMPRAFRELRLTSADPYLLVQATLDDAACALEQLRRDQVAAAKLVHQDRLHDAVTSLQQVFQTWQTVKDVAERASSLLGADLLNVPIEAADHPRSAALLGSTLSNELLAHLRAVKQALSRDDWSRLADVLSTQLVDLAHRWQHLMQGLAKHVGDLRPARAMSSPLTQGGTA